MTVVATSLNRDELGFTATAGRPRHRKASHARSRYGTDPGRPREGKANQGEEKNRGGDLNAIGQTTGHALCLLRLIDGRIRLTRVNCPAASSHHD
jgi:hypothetical protein